MRTFLERKWGKFGGLKVFLLKTRVYVVECKDVETRVEEAGPWTFDNRPLIVKPWTDDANLERGDMVEVPVWVRFPNLKLHMWSTTMLSKMASIIGKPLFMDRMTAERERLAYARDENGNKYWQKVEYEWIPVSCKGCGVFGHTDARCPKKPKVLQQWVIKKQDTDSGTGGEEEGINITGTRGSPQHVHGDTTKGNTSVVSVADKRTAEPGGINNGGVLIGGDCRMLKCE
ncbi:hypothetical protein LguiA_030353 [Lonicera macranthoides]